MVVFVTCVIMVTVFVIMTVVTVFVIMAVITIFMIMIHFRRFGHGGRRRLFATRQNCQTKCRQKSQRKRKRLGTHRSDVRCDGVMEAECTTENRMQMAFYVMPCYAAGNDRFIRTTISPSSFGPTAQGAGIPNRQNPTISDYFVADQTL
jgi:hypothetical protein